MAASAYNERRAQCEAGLEILQTDVPHAESLRDISLDEYSLHQGNLPEIIQKRVHHVVSEIARTLLATEYLQVEDWRGFGECMNLSHDSLRDDYQVSSFELDWLVDWSRSQQGVLGARLTGAGFGGCAIALIENTHVENFIARLPAEYLQATARTARCWVCEAAAGAALMPFDASA